MSIEEEIPHTETGLTTYMMYAERQMKENLLHNRRLEARIKVCQERLDRIKRGKIILMGNIIDN